MNDGSTTVSIIEFVGQSIRASTSINEINAAIDCLVQTVLG